MAKKQAVAPVSVTVAAAPEVAPVEVVTVPAQGAVATAEPLEEFDGFADERTPHDDVPTQVEIDVARATEESMREVAIIPRSTLMRVRIGNREDGSPAWYNFIKGKEVLVPKHIADWLHEQGIL